MPNEALTLTAKRGLYVEPGDIEDRVATMRFKSLVEGLFVYLPDNDSVCKPRIKPGPSFPITLYLRSYDHSHDESFEPSFISLERFPKLLLTLTRIRCTHDVRRIVAVR